MESASRVKLTFVPTPEQRLNRTASSASPKPLKRRFLLFSGFTYVLALAPSFSLTVVFSPASCPTQTLAVSTLFSIADPRDQLPFFQGLDSTLFTRFHHYHHRHLTAKAHKILD